MVNIDELLRAARASLDRVAPADLEDQVNAGAIIVDIRPVEQRERDGDLPGALVVDRNVLEWRLAPSSDTRIVDVAPGQSVIVVCNQGYQSSLAAATLQDLGLAGATDLEGGFEALVTWRRDPG